MNSDSKRLTYQRSQGSADLTRYAKAIGFPAGIFLLTLFTVHRFNLFGVNILVSWFLPSHRKSCLRETHVTIGVYLISLTVFKELVSAISGVSAEMLMATYNQAIPVTSGQAFSGYLQTMLWITAIMTPVGFIFMQVKKVFTMRRKQEVRDFHDRLLGTRKNGGHFD